MSISPLPRHWRKWRINWKMKIVLIRIINYHSWAMHLMKSMIRWMMICSFKSIRRMHWRVISIWTRIYLTLSILREKRGIAMRTLILWIKWYKRKYSRILIWIRVLLIYSKIQITLLRRIDLLRRTISILTLNVFRLKRKTKMNSSWFISRGMRSQ